jgi:hypothetical protein
MTNIEALKYIDIVIRNLHLNPDKVIEISIEVNYTEAKISLLDTKGNSFRYVFLLTGTN